MKKVYGDIEYIKSIFYSLLDFTHIKTILSLISIIISWIFEGNVTVLYSVYLLLTIDTITGIAKAIKFEGLESARFSRILWKSVVYFMMIVIGRVTDKHLPLHLLAPVMDTFVVATEALSVLENISELGFPVPTSVIKQLKVYRDRK